MHPNTRPRLQRAIGTRNADMVSRWLRRADVQLAFAAAFSSLLSERANAEGWKDLITKAEAVLENLDTNSGLFGLSGAVREAEGILAPIGNAAKEYSIHCVGHGHIDMNWMWSWQETASATFDTFRSVLDLMKEYPDVTYSQSQASVYALVEKYYPEMFAEIQERVKEGRWEVAAVHWVEGDKNIASGESWCRHVLYTRRYFAEKFGLSPEDVTLDWEPDTFGHANTLPGVLAQAGVKFYYSCRTGGGFDHAVVGPFPRPRLFWWQGLDGSRILVNRESTWYNSYVNIGDNIALPAVEFWQETGLKDWLNVYGFGNHGGGPTRKEIDYFIEMREWPIYPNVIFGTAKNWYETAEKGLSDSLPVLDHELNFEFTGCYTSESLIKQANRFGENYLVEAETLAAIASRAFGKAYPTERLREGWINVLFNQFHDILPGSGVRQTREHAMGLFQETGAITGAIKRTAGLALTAGIDTLSLLPETKDAEDEKAVQEAGHGNPAFEAGAGIQAMESGYSIAGGGGKRFKPFVVYNPCAWTRSEPVTVNIYDSDLDPGRLVARDETGVQHPTFFLGRGHDWGHDKLTLMFLAQDVPPLGYRTYILCEGVADAETPLVAGISDTEFETPYLHLKYDRYGSGFTQVTDRRTGAEVNDAFYAMGAWRYITENPRGMTAWVLGGESEPLGLKSHGYHVSGAARNAGTGRFANGALAFRLHQHLEVPGTKSSVRLTTVLHALEPRIDVTAEVDWREIGDGQTGIPGLYVEFPLNLTGDTTKSLYETPFGSVERQFMAGEEVPTLRYAHINDTVPGGTGCGFTLLQDCKYGHSIDDTNLRMRVIRSSYDPDHAPEVCKQTVRYSMYFHEGAADPATLTRLGAAWNHPLIVLPVNLQKGDRPGADGFVTVENDNVVLSTLKKPEDGDGLILRLAELNGAATEAVVTINPAIAKGLTKATVVDLMERSRPDLSATFDGKTLRVSIPANSFVTVALTA